ncbi:uncharacterized protein [Cardiocondyla obscurior]|uniref:uncharacterized protein n=1 Tax=Cardiocondyla obscurior TaxID=286306 RepID=UPI0039657DA9
MSRPDFPNHSERRRRSKEGIKHRRSTPWIIVLAKLRCCASADRKCRHRQDSITSLKLVQIDNTLALKEGPTRHSADILRRGRGPERTSCIGGATFSHRQISITPLELMQISKLHNFFFIVCNWGLIMNNARVTRT